MAGIRSSRQGSSDQPGEYDRFETALKKVLSVPHSEIKAKLDAEKQARKQQKKPSSSARASGKTD